MAMHWLLDNLNHIASVLPAFDTDARVIIQEAMNALTACSMPLYPQDDSQDGGPGFEVRQGDLEVAWQAAQDGIVQLPRPVGRSEHHHTGIVWTGGGGGGGEQKGKRWGRGKGRKGGGKAGLEGRARQANF